MGGRVWNDGDVGVRHRFVLALGVLGTVAAASAPLASGAAPGTVSNPGRLDPTFGTNGTIAIPLSHGATSAGGTVAVDPSTGRIWVYTFHETPKGVQRLELTAYRSDGRRDRGFHRGVPVRVHTNVGQDDAAECCSSTPPFPTPDGGVTLGFGFFGSLTVQHYTGTGALAWSTSIHGGLVDSAILSDGSFRALTIDFWRYLGEPPPLELHGLTPAGAPDAPDRATIDFVASVFAAGAIVADHADGLYVIGSRYADRVGASGRSVVVGRIGRDGWVDRRWGDGGRVTLDVGESEWLPASGQRQAILAPDGGLLLASRSPQNVRIQHLRPDGTTDPQFGDGGAITVESARGEGRELTSGPLLVDAKGGLIVGTSSRSSTDDSDLRAVLARFDAASGARDRRFGSGGSIRLDAVALDLALDADGRVMILGSVSVPRVSAHLGLSRRIVDWSIRGAPRGPVRPRLLQIPF
jgi:hypothetical protein